MSVGQVNSRRRTRRTVVERNRAIIVNDLSQLREVATLRGMLTVSPSVVLDLPDIDKEESSRWQSLINRLLSACGCAEGAVFLIVAILGYFGFLAIFRPEQPWLTWSTVGIAFGVAVGASLIGKLTGLIRARVLLGIAIRHLEARQTLKCNSRY
jgi:hypothetical protein